MEPLFVYILDLKMKKTQGVKKILAAIAKQLLAIDPHLTIGKTNLTEYLEN